MSKSIFKSKTFWLAVLQGVAGVLGVLHPDPTMKAAGGLAIAKSVVDVGLRLVTEDAVHVV
jgi:hypothetical protein